MSSMQCSDFEQMNAMYTSSYGLVDFQEGSEGLYMNYQLIRMQRLGTIITNRQGKFFKNMLYPLKI